MNKLKVTSIFLTLDGECTWGGPLQWSVFVRLGGCNLRCWKSSGFCDAPHSLSSKYPHPELTVWETFLKILTAGGLCKRVTITGGEPLLQKNQVFELVTRLRVNSFTTTLETGGSIGLTKRELGEFSHVIWDVKPPSTEMSQMMNWRMMANLRAFDFVKCVISDKQDFIWFQQQLKAWPTFAHVAVGPRWGYLEPAEIVEWMRESGLIEWRLNLQMHKYIWPDCVTGPVDNLDQVDVLALVKKEV